MHFSSNSNQSDSSLPTKLAKLEARMAGKGPSSAAPVQAHWQSAPTAKFGGMPDCTEALSSSDSDDDVSSLSLSPSYVYSGIAVYMKLGCLLELLMRHVFLVALKLMLVITDFRLAGNF